MLIHLVLKNSLNKTILMVTHDPKAAARAERVLHLEKGQLVRETVADDILVAEEASTLSEPTA